jgi:RimJ/RimL family protein N-acetyltransferase
VTEAAIQVRAAQESDLPWMLGQLEMFAALYPTKRSLWPGIDVAEQKLRDLIRDHPCFVACRGELRVGFVCGLLAPFYFNRDVTTLIELFWWVDPSYRPSRAATLLLDTFIRFGREHAHRIEFSATSLTRVRPASMKRRGFRPHTTQFLLESG